MEKRRVFDTREGGVSALAGRGSILTGLPCRGMVAAISPYRQDNMMRFRLRTL
jgi:hypothetical protein